MKVSKNFKFRVYTGRQVTWRRRGGGGRRSRDLDLLLENILFV